MIEKLSDLTMEERGFLAMHATYRSGQETDIRYWEKDKIERERLRARWREIADALHPDPWGSRSLPGPGESSPSA